MKKASLALALIVLLVGCNTKVKKENEALKAETALLKQENDSFRNQNMNLSSSLETYKKTLQEIDDNLIAIDKNATMVGKINMDGGSEEDMKEDILSRIESIKALLDNSKLKILALDRNLKELRAKYGEQSEEVLKLNLEIKAQTQALMDKETDFIIMQSEMQEDLDKVQMAYDQQVALSKELGAILNRAYYFAGTSKELKDKEVVDIEGGFIGLGRVKVLNANSKDGLFTQVKKDMTDTLTFTTKGAELVTEHPSDSYTLVEEKDQVLLIIKDKTTFWKSTNYLVVKTK